MDTSPPSAPTPTKPVITRSRSVWLGEQRFRSGSGERTHLIDAGAKAAPGPVETLLGAIATCSGVDVIDILAKRRTPVESLEVEVAGHRRPVPPRRLVRLEVEYRVNGAGIDREHAERAIQLAFEKYCSVAASLAPDIEAWTTLVLGGERQEPVRQQIWTASPD